MADYKDISDWVMMDYTLQDQRLAENNKIYLNSLKEFATLFNTRYKFRKVDTRMVQLAISFYNKSIEKGIDQELLKGDSAFSYVLKGLVDGGIFTISPIYGNFRYYDFTLVLQECEELININNGLQYFNGMSRVYGPRSGGAGDGELVLVEMEDSYTSILPELNTNDEIAVVMERIEMIQDLKRYNRRLTNLNKNVDKIFNSHRDKINKELDESKNNMIAKDWLSFQKKKLNSYNSMSDRFYFSTRAISRIVEN